MWLQRKMNIIMPKFDISLVQKDSIPHTIIYNGGYANTNSNTYFASSRLPFPTRAQFRPIYRCQLLIQTCCKSVPDYLSIIQRSILLQLHTFHSTTATVTDQLIPIAMLKYLNYSIQGHTIHSWMCVDMLCARYI